jgi:hypothetical protein
LLKIILKRLIAINIRFSDTQQVQIWPINNQYLHYNKLNDKGKFFKKILNNITYKHKIYLLLDQIYCNRGAFATVMVDERQAENIPFEPDADNADAGKKNKLPLLV